MTYISNRNTIEGKKKGFNAVSATNFVLAYSQEAQRSFRLIPQANFSLKQVMVLDINTQSHLQHGKLHVF